MPSQKRQDRIERILRTLQATRGASLGDLATILGVSEMTVRRDLELLATESRVRLVHTAVLPAESPTPGHGRAWPDESAGAEERMRIGMKAASLIESGDVVIVDSGSTTEWLARSLPLDLPVTILCFALNILVEASRGTARTLVFAGGAMRPDTFVFQGPEAVSLVRRYRATKAFLSAGGASEKLGVTCADPGEAELKKAAMSSAQTRILLVDSRKFGTVKPAWFADLSGFDAVITDPGISLEYVEILRGLGIALHVV
jgi:DeoR family transcriptional regulator, deoxyribose operon repressor